MSTICVFCGSSSGVREDYLTAARELGTAIATTGLRLVYGGTKTGLMGALADAALARGGTVIGVPARAFVDKGLAHDGLTRLEIVNTMAAGKTMMAQLADAFVSLPGGYGTFDEIFEMLTLQQLGLQQKPVGLLNVAGFFDPLIQLVDHTVTEGFLSSVDRQLIRVATTPGALVKAIAP